jgi:hypothetical protein
MCEESSMKMKTARRLIQVLLIAAWTLVFQVSAVQATIEHIHGEDFCKYGNGCGSDFQYPVLQDRTTTVTLEGQYVDISTGLEVTGSGVTITGVSTSSSKKTIRIAVSSNAAPGLRTVKLHYLVEVNGPDTFKILVVRKGRITGVEAPPLTQFFSEADVILTGENIGNAAVFLATFPGTVKVAESTDSRVVVHLKFNNGPLAEITGTLYLYDKAYPVLGSVVTAFLYSGISDNQGGNKVTILGPNALHSITFPEGNTVAPGGVLTVKVTLLRSVLAPIGRQRVVASRTGEPFFWQVVPSTSFQAAAGSGTQFSPTGQNEAHVTEGDSVLLKVRLVQPPSGCPSQGCEGQVQVRLGNMNTNSPLSFQLKSFTMLPGN